MANASAKKSAAGKHAMVPCIFFSVSLVSYLHAILLIHDSFFDDILLNLYSLLLLSITLARQAAAEFYQPFLFCVNVVYAIVRYWKDGWHITWWGYVGLALLGALQAWSYQGIIDHAQQPRSAKDTALVGGASLDVLGLVLVVQFGTVLLSYQLYWLLLVIPLWGLSKLYSTVRGFGLGGGSNDATTASGVTPSTVDGKKRVPRKTEKRR
jgi:hypothetical protein